ncbi:GSCOCG00003169001-RA-CDS [Cotesia congregata]|nr:GSCOCG00003169001-RA-CDS [Cotesia congregata]
METEIYRACENGADEKNLIIQEYETIVESLQQDLNACKLEQKRLREEIEILKQENKNASDLARESFKHANNTECPNNAGNQENIDNLKQQISIIQSEKESMFQLWQMALKAVDVLEQELKATHPSDGKTKSKYYEEQINSVKEAYSEAIKVLEAKLIQVRDNFTRHQTLWESTRDKLALLKNEKTDLENKIVYLQNELTSKEETSSKTIEILKADCINAKQQVENIQNLKLKVDNELIEMKAFANRLAAKDLESKEKVAEAIELIETAVREKEIVLQREARVIEEKSKLENRLANLSKEFTARLDKELTELKSNYEKNIQKYLFEIKELKAELRDKGTLIDRVQRESRLYEEELLKVRHSSEDMLQRNNSRSIELEQKLKDAEYKIENCEETCRRKYEERIRQSDNKVNELEEKLASCNDRLRRNQMYSMRDVEDRVKEADDRTKEAFERYAGLEKRFARALEEREGISNELRTLQLTFDREITRRDNERRLLDSRIRELQEELRKANDLADKATARANSLFINENQSMDLDKSIDLKIMQDKYEEKISELTRYVKVHQKLSNKWKEEAQSLADKFQSRYKELRSKVSILKNENEELNKELVTCRQQIVAVQRAHLMERYDHGEGAR